MYSFIPLVAPPEVQQIPDGEQTPARAVGAQRNACVHGRQWQRGLLVLHQPLLQAAVQRRQRCRG